MSCLAAGSSIMNKEAESTAMRPLAKAVTKSLETVRNLLRDTCLRNNTPNGPIKLDSNELVTEMLLESLKIFDKLFAEFELAYVSAMVPVKTTQEYELQEFIGVLFSETLQRALKMKLLTQEMVDDCDPALMFTIPRLAIVSGLLIFPSGPLCIDRPVEEMSSMFRPFRTLLHKIRELLWTLNKRELYMLEKLLCDNEQISDVKSVSDVDVHCELDDFIDQFYSDYHTCKDYPTSNFYNTSGSDLETDKLATVEDKNFDQHLEDAQRISSSTVDIPSTSGYLIPNSIAHDIIVASITDTPQSSDRIDSPPDHDSLEVISVAAATLSSILTTEETAENSKNSPKNKAKTDLESPSDSGICTENTSLDRSPSLDCQCAGNPSSATCKCSARVKNSPRHVSKGKKSTQSDFSPGTSKLVPKATLPARKRGKIPKQIEGLIDEDSSSVGSSDTSSFNSNCADDEEIALAMQAAQIASRNEVRAKYRWNF
ncbi:hypothetical protein BDFB_010438 [Asbolus verrucosus]|uniref:Lateral signaling target protein 2 homolog n=1 Tax=Asbolus verrucosus TaxID=1661398 RepID=A0A482VB77_ASBVE|nr:hypothetical protein BDFB_010438 [Asbolus verrucosus]